MSEIEKIDTEGRKAGPAAFLYSEGSNYNITYYVPVRQALRELENQYTCLPTERSITERSPEDRGSEREEDNTTLFMDHKELYIPSDIMDLTPEALSYLDNNQYRISYYIKLRDYYREKQEYEDKLRRHNAGEKEVFQKKVDPLLFYSDESADLTAKALSELDGNQHRMSYYVELEDYYKKAREYREKMLYYQAGNKEAFKEKILSPVFYSSESTDLSAYALSEIDGKKFRSSHYQKLREYQKEREEYERKLLFYKMGETDIFERKDAEFIPVDIYKLSAEALSYIDGNKYRLSYYKNLEKYYEELQDYNVKLARHNAGYEDAFQEKSDTLPSYSREKLDLSARGLSEMDGRRYKISYYQKLRDYYKETEEYERKKLLYFAGDKDAFKSEEEEYINTKDKIEFSRDNDLWTPKFNDMIAALKGKLAPYFMDNLFETLGKIDKRFEPVIANSPLIRLYLTCSTEVTPEDELLRELEKVQSLIDVQLSEEGMGILKKSYKIH
ncbi:MAG TPA: hypothetical protein PL110_18220 [Candidatus Eremiobacteraeota bacterium]|nr:MAG: hypothetical protein BWY64_01248 [bacterium ADurb.Bin363]HPZ10033.1 hypothetical protein [Candidatus Eremiobacteraeota bacterium]